MSGGAPPGCSPSTARAAQRRRSQHRRPAARGLPRVRGRRRGAGPGPDRRRRGQAFCAGADLKSVAAAMNDQGIAEQWLKPRPHGPLGFTRITSPKPTIAAISGYALAGGLELALWCDLRIGTETAKLGFPERRWGVPLIDGGTQRLPRVVGMGRALDMIITGRIVEAEEALGMGLLTEMVAPGKHLERALEMAEGLAQFPQETMLADRRSALEGFGLLSRGGPRARGRDRRRGQRGRRRGRGALRSRRGPRRRRSGRLGQFWRVWGPIGPQTLHDCQLTSPSTVSLCRSATKRSSSTTRPASRTTWEWVNRRTPKPAAVCAWSRIRSLDCCVAVR